MQALYFYIAGLTLDQKVEFLVASRTTQMANNRISAIFSLTTTMKWYKNFVRGGKWEVKTPAHHSMTALQHSKMAKKEKQLLF